MTPEHRLEELGIALGRPSPAATAYVPCVLAGTLAFVSGHIAQKDGQPWTGRLGKDISTEEGAKAARAIAIDLMSTLKEAVGELGQVARIVKLVVLVNAAADFTEAHLVANGASQLMTDVFGLTVGAHARSAFGVAQLPRGACVEIEMIAELR